MSRDQGGQTETYRDYLRRQIEIAHRGHRQALWMLALLASGCAMTALYGAIG